MLQLIQLYFLWHFFEFPKRILEGWKNILSFTLNYFSAPLLLKTLFSPWRRQVWQTPKGFHPSIFFENLIGNLISRLLGALIRASVIVAAIPCLFLVFFAGFLALCAWLLIPFAIIVSLFYGLKLLF